MVDGGEVEADEFLAGVPVDHTLDAPEMPLSMRVFRVVDKVHAALSALGIVVVLLLIAAWEFEFIGFEDLWDVPWRWVLGALALWGVTFCCSKMAKGNS